MEFNIVIIAVWLQDLEVNSKCSMLIARDAMDIRDPSVAVIGEAETVRASFSLCLYIAKCIYLKELVWRSWLLTCNNVSFQLLLLLVFHILIFHVWHRVPCPWGNIRIIKVLQRSCSWGFGWQGFIHEKMELLMASWQVLLEVALALTCKAQKCRMLRRHQIGSRMFNGWTGIWWRPGRSACYILEKVSRCFLGRNLFSGFICMCMNFLQNACIVCLERCLSFHSIHLGDIEQPQCQAFHLLFSVAAIVLLVDWGR